MSTTLLVGSGQQYKTCQSAVQALQAGGTVYLNSDYSGPGCDISALIPKACFIQQHPAAKITGPVSSSSQAIFNFENANDITLASILINSPSLVAAFPNQDGIRFVNGNGASAIGCNVQYCGKNACLYSSHCQNTTWQGCIAKFGIGQHCIYVANSDLNTKCIGCTFSVSVNACAHYNADKSQGGTGLIQNLLISGCIITGSDTAITVGGKTYAAQGGKGLNCDGVQNSRCEDTVIANNGGIGAALFQEDGAGPCLNFQFANVAFANNGGGDMEVEDGSTVTVMNTISDKVPTVDSSSKLTGYSGSGAAAGSGNLVGQSQAKVFAGASSGNYLLATGSPAIGIGVASYASVNAPTTDLLGVPFNPKSICAGPYQVASATPPPPPILTTINLSPANAALAPVTTQQFTATGMDNSTPPKALSPQPAFTWSAKNGTITRSGLYSAPATGTDTVTASSGSVKATAAVTVTTVAPTQTPTSISYTPGSSAVELDQTGKPMVAQPTFTYTDDAAVVSSQTVNGATTFTFSTDVTVKSSDGLTTTVKSSKSL